VLRLQAGVDFMLSFDEVVEALGRVSERDLAVHTIANRSPGDGSGRSTSRSSRSCARPTDRPARDRDRRLPAAVGDRYRLMRTHSWTDEAIERVRRGR